MKPFFLSVLIITAAAGLLRPASAAAQNASPFAGVWSLNRSLSESPREIGFNVDWMPAPTTESAGSSSGGRGRGSGSAGRSSAPFATRRESSEDARRVQLLTAEARNPPVRLVIVDTPAALTITNELGQSRTLHPDGKEESIDIQGLPTRVTTKRETDRIIAVYHVEQDRDVRFTYSRSTSPPQLLVEVQFLEHGTGDKARRVYEPGVATDTATSPAPAGGAPAGSTPQEPEKFDERPGAELKGLKSLGILVEDLSSQAIGCGLSRDALETALSRRLTAGGFTVRKNSDEDTYVYVNVMTTTVANGLCVSRYDAFLYTHATANLTYRDRPVLVQVSLIHRGGIGSSAPVAHAEAVTRGLENYIDLFVTQIHDANK